MEIMGFPQLPCAHAYDCNSSQLLNEIKMISTVNTINSEKLNIGIIAQNKLKTFCKHF